jgi:hypothetical protein
MREKASGPIYPRHAVSFEMVDGKWWVHVTATLNPFELKQPGFRVTMGKIELTHSYGPYKTQRAAERKAAEFLAGGTP